MASAVVPDRDAVPLSRRSTRIVEWLCGGLLLFGVIRIAPLAAEFAGVERPGYPAGIIPSGLPPLAEVEALTAFSLLWPVANALVWWWFRGRGPARAAAVTFLALGCENLSVLFTGGVSSFGVGGAQWGSFATPLAAVLAVLALMAAGLAWRAARQSGRNGDQERAADRKNIGGRLIVLGAVVFALAVLVAESWSLYLKVMEQNPTLRNWVLRSDRALRKMGPTESPRERRARASGTMMREGMEFAMVGRHREARHAYQSALDGFDALAREDPDPRRFVRSRAFAANNLAWLFATCPDTSLRNPARAVELAERSVALVPEDANSWNTLGAAYYRAGEYDAALGALGRSMKLSSGGHTLDWYLRAMIHAQRGEKAEAREWYDRATHWTKTQPPLDSESYRFQSETAALLGLPQPATPTPIDRMRFPGAPYGPESIPARPLSGTERRERE